MGIESRPLTLNIRSQIIPSQHHTHHHTHGISPSAMATDVPLIVIDSTPCNTPPTGDDDDIPIELDLTNFEDRLETPRSSMEGPISSDSRTSHLPTIPLPLPPLSPLSPHHHYHIHSLLQGLSPDYKRSKHGRSKSASPSTPSTPLTTVPEQFSEDDEDKSKGCPPPDTTTPHTDIEHPTYQFLQPPQANSPTSEADRIIKAVRVNRRFGLFRRASPAYSTSKAPNPNPTFDDHSSFDNNYSQPTGILSALLSLASQSQSDFDSRGNTPAGTPMPSPPASGTSTPRFKVGPYGFGSRSAGSSVVTLAGNEMGSTASATPINIHSPSSTTSLLSSSTQDLVSAISDKLRYEQNKQKFKKYKTNLFRRSRGDRDANLKAQIAQTLAKQQFLVRLCWAFMRYGAPSHRIEEFLTTTAAVIHVEGQFLYTPACTIISFDDLTTHTTEVKLVRAPPGADLGKLYEAYDVYKDVTHGRMGVEEAASILRDITDRKDKFPRWSRVLAHGLAAAAVGPFGFQGRLIDIPACFLLGIILGTMQLYVSEFGTLYSNLFEIGAATITSFLARALGSIHGGSVFCFSALAQSSIALILPGYIVLCACLELTSHNILAGSVRMVYAVLYTIFLGYGIMSGAALYGLMDSNATSAVGCSNPLPYRFNVIWVALFSLALCLVNQAHWRHMPVMITISLAAYCTSYFSSKYYFHTSPLSNMCGAFVVGVLANLYSRLGPRFDNWSADVWFGIVKRMRVMRGVTEEKIEYMDRTTLEPDNINTSNPPGSDATTPHDAPSTTADPEKGQSRVHFNPDLPEYPYTKPTPAEGPESQGTQSKSSPVRRKKIGSNLAAAAMLPALWVQVPSGLAVSGSLLTGITSADQIIRGGQSKRSVFIRDDRIVEHILPDIPTANISSPASSDFLTLVEESIRKSDEIQEVTITLSNHRNHHHHLSAGVDIHLRSRADSAATPSSTPTVTANVNSSALQIMYSVVQVGVAMTVGLTVGALVVYPFGKKKRGIFSF